VCVCVLTYHETHRTATNIHLETCWHATSHGRSERAAVSANEKLLHRCRILKHQRLRFVSDVAEIFDSLRLKRSRFYLNTQGVPRSKHTISVIKTKQLVLHREIIAVCSEVHTKHINTLCVFRRWHCCMLNLVISTVTLKL
jgi:hypothetical protein